MSKEALLPQPDANGSRGQTALPRPARERGKIAPTKFAHAVMRTSRYSEMVDWYKTVLEAEPTPKGEYSCTHRPSSMVSIA